MTITPEDMPDGRLLSKEEKEEWNTHVIAEAEKETQEYQYQGELNPRQSVITRTQEQWATRDLMKRKHRGEPIIPVFHFTDPETGDTQWVLTDEDAMAVMQGYVCENCLEWQRIPNSPKCEWNNGGTCGYVNYRP